MVLPCITAGSAGDPNAPQFIVENRAVTLEYARDGGKFGTDRDAGQGHGGSSGVVGGGGGSRGRPIKTDWLCEMVRCILTFLLHYLNPI